MQLIITKSLSKSLKKAWLSSDDIIYHFQKTYLWSDKCPLLAHHNNLFMYKSYLTKIERMISMVVIDETIVPIFVGTKSSKLAQNLTKQTIHDHIDTWIATQKNDIQQGLFTSYAIAPWTPHK